MYVKKIFNQSLLYGLGSSFTSLVSFLILPVYTKLLSVQDFGKLSLILTAIFLLQYIYNMGVYSGFMIKYFDLKSDDVDGRRRLNSTILFFYLAFCSVASVLIYFFLGARISVFMGSQGRAVVFFIVLIPSCEILYALPTAIMRLEERIIAFISINFLKSLFLWVAVFVALRATNGTLNAALAAQLAVVFAATLLAYLLTYRHYAFIFDIRAFKDSVKIGLPFLIVMLSFWLIDSVSKFMVKYYLSLTDVALYSMGFKIGQSVLLVVTIFQLVWQPMMFRIASEGKASEIYARIFNYFILAVFTVSLAVSLFSRKLILLFSTESYVSSAGLVPLIVFAYAFYGFFYYLQTPLIIKKRLIYLMLVCVGGTVFNIAANIIAIPFFGITGAAYATLITYIVMSCAVLLASQKVFHISYDFVKIIKISAAVLLVSLLGRWDPWRGFSSILFQLAMIFLFFIMLFVLRFFDDRDIFFLKGKLRLFQRIAA